LATRLGKVASKSTLGIVSGRERLGYFGYFQVTSPLNPGNSGGPAVNQKGEVVGINSRGILEAQSVGYIIPINEVKTALKDLYHIKILRKPTLGGIFTYATNEMVDYLGNPSQGGWYIAKVFDNTLLKSVGIQKDDMLYAINGHEVDMYGELDVPWSEDKVSLFEIMNRYKVGDTMKFLIYRKGKPMTFKFKLEDKYLPAIRTYYQEFEPQARDYEVLGGMVVMNLTVNHIGLLLPRVRELIKYAQPEKQQDPAVVITHVFPNSQCDKAQVLRPGQVIDEINGIKIKTLKDFRHAVTESRQDGYLRINTSDNILAVLGVDKILNDEPTLANRYFYQPSPLLQALKIEPTNNNEVANA
jgi:S1-C subfamily serine protease